MSQTQEFAVTCGTTKMRAHLPVERTRIPPGPPPSAPTLPDAASAFRRALANPVGMPPLEKLVRRGATVTIGVSPAPVGMTSSVDAQPPDQTGSVVLDAVLGGYWATFWSILSHSLLPIVTVGVFFAAPVSKIVRTGMVQALASPQIEFARAYGLAVGLVEAGYIEVPFSYSVKEALEAAEKKARQLEKES